MLTRITASTARQFAQGALKSQVRTALKSSKVVTMSAGLRTVSMARLAMTEMGAAARPGMLVSVERQAVNRAVGIAIASKLPQIMSVALNGPGGFLDEVETMESDEEEESIRSVSMSSM